MSLQHWWLSSALCRPRTSNLIVVGNLRVISLHRPSVFLILSVCLSVCHLLTLTLLPILGMQTASFFLTYMAVLTFIGTPMNALKIVGLIMFTIKTKIAGTHKAKQRAWSEQYAQYGKEVKLPFVSRFADLDICFNVNMFGFDQIRSTQQACHVAAVSALLSVLCLWLLR